MGSDMTTMREVEPELGAIEAYELSDEPPFPIVIRGYDRRAVDEFVDAAHARVAELEAQTVPTLAVRQAVERLADDTGSILKEAHETADTILSRAREEAEITVRDAREEAERTIASAQARARQIAIDTDNIWNDRMRLIEDAQAIAAALNDVADAAHARFPAEEHEAEEPAAEDDEPATTAFDPIVEQPTEALDVTALWAAEDAEAESRGDAEPAHLEPDEDRPSPEGLDDLEPPPEFRA